MNLTKTARLALLLFALTFLVPGAHRCYLIGEPLAVENYKTKGGKITRSDAALLIEGAMLELGFRCPAFGAVPDVFNHGANPEGDLVEWIAFSWPNMLHRAIYTGCTSRLRLFFAKDPNDTPPDDFILGCADEQYLSRGPVETCKLMLNIDPCEPIVNGTFYPFYGNTNVATIVHRFIMLDICENAFNESGEKFVNFGKRL